MSRIFSVLMLLGVATLSSFSYAITSYSPKIVIHYLVQGTQQQIADPAADCATASGSFSFSGPDASGAFKCSGTTTGGSYLSVTYVPVKGCPAGFTPTNESDPAKACSSEAPPPPDCSDKIGQSDSRYVQCGVYTCSSGWVSDPDGKIGCNAGLSVVGITPPQTATVQGCPAVLSSLNQIKPKIPVSSVGSTAGQPIFCMATYVVTGDSPPANPPVDPVPPPSESLKDPGTGTGGAGSGLGSAPGAPGASGTGAGKNGDGSGTAGEAGSPCIPTATNPCTGSGVDCVPTVAKPCTHTGKGSGDCIPTATQPCTGSGSSTTQCSSSPVCTGDGVQCAQVIQTWKSTCEVNKTLSYLDPADKASADNAAQAEENKISSKQGEVDQQGQALLASFQSALSQGQGGQCMQDQSISVLSVSIEIPFSELCDLFKLIRVLLLLSAYLFSARVIFGAV